MKSKVATKVMTLALQIEELENVIEQFTEQTLEAEYEGYEGQAHRYWTYVEEKKNQLNALNKKAGRIL
jgi:hypothetical protein